MERADVIILGGGLVGLTLALALDAHGLTVIVVDPADPEAQLAPGFDGRASAIASASGRMLAAIGLGARLDGLGCAIREIRVSDGLAAGGLDFRPADEAPLGTMYENHALRRVLREAAAEAKGVSLMTPATPASVERGLHGVSVTLADPVSGKSRKEGDSPPQRGLGRTGGARGLSPGAWGTGAGGRTLTAPLLVGAEGRNSPSRAAAGINVARWKYDHAAIIAGIGHDRPHGNIAYEIFYPAGPFAILPLLPDADGLDRSALVWSVRAKDAPGLLKLSDRGFLAEAEKAMGGFLGRLTATAPRASYPLGFHHAARITAERLALVGDAAHGIHPIAGQGLNLGLRDVAALTEVLVEGARLGLDLGDAQLLARYERWRGLDTLSVAFATDTLTRLFGVPGRTASAVRRLGLSAVERIAPLKDRFMAEARGETGALPRLLQGMTV